MSEGVKGDQGKPPIYRGVLAQFPAAMAGVATISAYGADKYSWTNWRSVSNGIDRYSDALVRHLTAEAAGEVLDPESGLPHAWSVVWNALARAELITTMLEKGAIEG